MEFQLQRIVQNYFRNSSLSIRKLKRVITLWMPLTTGHHGRPPVRMRALDNFHPSDIKAAHDFLLAIKSLFPDTEIPSFGMMMQVWSCSVTCRGFISAAVVLG